MHRWQPIVITRASVVLAALLIGCAPKDPLGTQRLALTVPNIIEVDNAKQLAIVLLSFNPNNLPLSYTVTGLPVFASFSGNQITFAPRGLIDVGDSTFTVAVTDGVDSDRKDVVVRVLRPYTAPKVAALYWMTGCPGWSCDSCPPMPGTFIDNYVVDTDLDQVALQVEVVPVGGTLTGTPTFTSPFADVGGEASMAQFHVVLPDLTVGSSYIGRMRGIDSTGMTSTWVSMCGSGEDDYVPFSALP